MDSRTARFDRLFDERRRAVYAFFFASTHDAGAAEDGVQETFLRVWRRLDALTPEGEWAYILRAARSVATDAARRAKVRPVMAEEVDRASEASGPYEAAASGMAVERLDAAIRALPDDLRMPLVMATLGGMESGEIGEILGKPPGTVRYLIHKARERLEKETT